MFYIRADGNTEIGMGHVMRCLSIADALKARNIAPVFITASEECTELVHSRGYETFLLETDYQEMDLEMRQLAELFSRSDPHRCSNTILVDSYQVTEPYFFRLRNYAKVACMEDMGYSYPVDLLINYNVYASTLTYTGNFKRLLGSQYVPLREEFCKDCEYTVRDRVQHVMLTTGGSDPRFISREILNMMLSEEKLANLTYHVISGPFNSFRDELENYAKDHENIIIYENVKSMKEIMQMSDVVISATGSTLYEVGALGVPMISFYFAENQKRGARYLAETTDIVNAGNIMDFREITLRKLQETLLRCVEDHSYCETISRQEKELVDGKGASRIAEALISL